MTSPLDELEDRFDRMDELDLGGCDYIRRGLPGADPQGTCGFGCYDEPSCMTTIPREGWPSLNAAVEAHRAFGWQNPEKKEQWHERFGRTTAKLG